MFPLINTESAGTGATFASARFSEIETIKKNASDASNMNLFISLIKHGGDPTPLRHAFCLCQVVLSNSAARDNLNQVKAHFQFTSLKISKPTQSKSRC